MQAHSLCCGGKLINLDQPQVMGIINITPDSFHAESRTRTVNQVLGKAEKMLRDGADWLDLGACSSRPGADDIPESEEQQRLIPAVEAVKKAFPDALLSVDTFRSTVARAALDLGADMINDITAGTGDRDMFDTVATFRVPMVLMHMQGTPKTMQQSPYYDNLLASVHAFFSERTARAREAGVVDLLIDPGFGFGKTVEHNYTLARHLRFFQNLETPVLVGVSRKSMFTRLLDISPEHTLNATTAMHMALIERKADILRVHDVAEAVQTRTVYQALQSS